MPLVPHFGQLRLWRSASRFKIVTAGRRSGKTELAKRKMVEQLVYWTRKGSSQRMVAGAPTRAQAEKIFFQDLMDLIDPDWIEAVRAGELCIETISGASISVVGLDEPQRIEGIEWSGAVIDEIADCPMGTWMKHVMPALAREDAWGWVIGVPDEAGRNFREQERLMELARADVGGKVWSHHTWSAEEIISREMATIFRGAMDARTYEQEIHGRTTVRSSAAFEDFRRAVHVKPCGYRAGVPLNWALDFNVNPMCSGIFQRVGEEMHVLAELTERHSDTMRACELFERTVAERGWDATGVGIYGDATGNARDSTSGVSDWEIVRARLARYRPTWRVPRSNPTQRASLNAVRGLLRNAAGEVGLRIDPSCGNLIRDMEEAEWPGRLEEHHHLAWLRYVAAEVGLGEFGVAGIERRVGGVVGFSRWE